jgi:serine/threonine protein kinase/tetratricopeptide (TPR) repeat protein
MSLTPGRRLGRFEIVGPLGAGGMGEVYRAHDTRLTRDVALKVLPETVAGDAHRLERFERETRALAALNHPNIVSIYSVEDIEGVRFFTMELVEGAPLSADAGLPLSEIFAVAIPVADALGAAHEKGFVHRDLKPANVMVDRHGRVKVLDFGLAKAAFAGSAADASATRLMTEAGVVFGTVPYMAPEQISGHGNDTRADVFSFGVLLHELATGARPFSGDSSPELMSAILRDVPPPLTDRRPDLPQHLARIVRRCLEKSPADRYQTMREVERELRDLKKETDSEPSRRLSTAASAVQRQSFWIAVRPLKVAQNDADLQAFGEGLLEDLTAGLSRFPYLSVAARDAAQQTRYLLEGSVRKSGSMIRVSMQLVDAQSGTQMWAETYDRNLGSGDIFAIQDDVTDRVVATVADVYGVLVRSMMHSIREVPIERLSSLELLLRYWTYHQNPKADEHMRLRPALEAATAKEPNNAEVWAALAWIYTNEHSHFFNVQPDPLLRARRAARKAVDLDPAGQPGWEALAVVHFFDRDREAFLSAADRAMAINPRNTNTAAFLALLLSHMGETERAFAIATRARQLNSHHPGWYHCVEHDYHHLAGDYEAAYVAVKKINMPELVFAQLMLADVCGHLGRLEEGRAALQAVFALEPSLADPRVRHEVGKRWFWTEELGRHFRQGLEKLRESHPEGAE